MQRKRQRIEVTDVKEMSADEELFLFIGSKYREMDGGTLIGLVDILNRQREGLDAARFKEALDKVDLLAFLRFAVATKELNLAALIIELESKDCCCDKIEQGQAKWLTDLADALKLQRLHYNQNRNRSGGDIIIEFDGAAPAEHCLNAAKKFADACAKLIRAARNAIVYGPAFEPACVVCADGGVLYAPAAEDRGRLDCVVCMNKERNVMFDACTHVCVCEECAEQVDKCPMCRGDVAVWRKVLLS